MSELHPVPKPPKKQKKAKKPLGWGPSKRSAKSKGHLFPAPVDEARRQYIRGLSCILSLHKDADNRPHRCDSIVLACHVKSRGSGGKDAGNMFPGCNAVNQEHGRIGTIGFERKHGVALSVVAARLERVYVSEAWRHLPDHQPPAPRPDHWPDCWRVHLPCAIEEIQRLRTTLDTTPMKR